MKLDTYIKLQEQLYQIQLKVEIFNVASAYYIEKHNDDLEIDEEIRTYIGTDYTKMF